MQINGNSSESTLETIGTLTLQSGFSNIALNPASGQSLSFVAGANFPGIVAGATVLLDGVSATSGNGLATISTLSTAAFPVSAGQGGGADGTTTMTIRPDMIGSTSLAGTNLEFIVKDPTTGNLRPLTSAELAPSYIPGGATNGTTNFSLSATPIVAGIQSANTLTLLSGGGIALTNTGANTAPTTVANPAITGINGTNPDISTFTLTAGGVLAYSGNTGINVGALASPNTGYYFYTVGSRART